MDIVSAKVFGPFLFFWELSQPTPAPS